MRSEILYESLRLDYPGSVYKPMSDDSLGVIRYTTDETSKISIPYGTEMGGTVTEAPPLREMDLQKQLMEK